MEIPLGCCSTLEPFPLVLRAASLGGKTWLPGQPLRVGFLDGPIAYRRRVETHIKTWEEGTGVRFVVVDSGEADIRVTFRAAPGRFYSLIGTDSDATGFGPDGHTMNLGFPPEWPLGTEPVEREIRRLILHEFGHALGLVHEHSSPEAGSFFKDPTLVYEYYQRNYEWTREMVDANVLTVYSPDRIGLMTRFDPESIMLYQFPPEITNRPTAINYELSAGDRALAAALYPPAETATWTAAT